MILAYELFAIDSTESLSLKTLYTCVPHSIECTIQYTMHFNCSKLQNCNFCDACRCEILPAVYPDFALIKALRFLVVCSTVNINSSTCHSAENKELVSVRAASVNSFSRNRFMSF